jgi:hypothetical protein
LSGVFSPRSGAWLGHCSIATSVCTSNDRPASITSTFTPSIVSV